MYPRVRSSLRLLSSSLILGFSACSGTHSTSGVPPTNQPAGSSTIDAGHYRTFDDALSACPSSGACTITFPAGVWPTTYYAGNRCISRSDLSLLATRKPGYDSTSAPTKLIGGAIIQPGLSFCGASNLTMQGIGFDDGPAYFARTGIATDGLRITGRNRESADPLVTKIAMDHIVALGPGTNAPLHGFLIEHAKGVSSYARFAALYAECHVIRSQEVEDWEVQSSGCGKSGLLIQSDDYTQVSQVFVNGAYTRALHPGDTQNGFIVEASGPQGVSNVTFQGASSVGPRIGFRLVDHSATGPGGLANIVWNRSGVTLENLPEGDPPVCLLSQSDSPQATPSISVLSFDCVNNTALPAIPLEIQNDLGNSSIQDWVSTNGGQCSMLGGTFTIDQWRDEGTASTVPTFCTHDANTHVIVRGLSSTRGNLPYTDLYPGSVIQIE